jgi:hypothetical protein
MYLSKLKELFLPIIKEGLSTECTIESEKELRNGKDHIFVEEIKNHFGNSNI